MNIALDLMHLNTFPRKTAKHITQSRMFVIKQKLVPDSATCLLLMIAIISCLLPRTKGFAIKEFDEFAIGQTTTIDNVKSNLTAPAPIVCGAPENFLQGNFTLYDYSVVLGMLVISLGIGKINNVIPPEIFV